MTSRARCSFGIALVAVLAGCGDDAVPAAITVFTSDGPTPDVDVVSTMSTACRPIT
ncbi:MAG TPA: hypothetical protein VKB80_12675 [Kofleriaceae bacterium]|nr:hypothetical protein [Kofleriaceae bacterium]